MLPDHYSFRNHNIYLYDNGLFFFSRLIGSTMFGAFELGYTCRTTVNFGTLKDGSLQSNSSASNNCFSYRNVFQSDGKYISFPFNCTFSATKTTSSSSAQSVGYLPPSRHPIVPAIVLRICLYDYTACPNKNLTIFARKIQDYK